MNLDRFDVVTQGPVPYMADKFRAKLLAASAGEPPSAAVSGYYACADDKLCCPLPVLHGCFLRLPGSPRLFGNGSLHGTGCAF